MDKKWFVYLQDHHEGPFLKKELEAMLAERKITYTTLVWQQGMTEWLPLEKIGELNILTQTVLSMPLAGPTTSASSSPQESAGEKKIPIEPTIGINLDWTKPFTITSSVYKKKSLNFGNIFARINKKIIVAVLFLGCFASISILFMSFGVPVAIQQHPLLAPYFLPFPKVPDVTDEDFLSLVEAARAPKVPKGTKIALVTSQKNLEDPIFYIASNVEDNVTFEVKVFGIANTLLNAGFYYNTTTATIKNKLAIAKPLAQNNKIPQGEFVVIITPSGDANDSLLKDFGTLDVKTIGGEPTTPVITPKEIVFLKKNFFLGGIKNSQYHQRLMEYHKLVAKKAQQEYLELKKVYQNLNFFLGQLKQQHSALKKSYRKKISKKKWVSFYTSWEKKCLSIVFSTQKWPHNVTTGKHFYNTLFPKVKALVFQLIEMGRLVNAIWSVYPPLKSPNVWNNLNAKYKQILYQQQSINKDFMLIEHNPPYPSGLPRKLYE